MFGPVGGFGFFGPQPGSPVRSGRSNVTAAVRSDSTLDVLIAVVVADSVFAIEQDGCGIVSVVALRLPPVAVTASTSKDVSAPPLICQYQRTRARSVIAVPSVFVVGSTSDALTRTFGPEIVYAAAGAARARTSRAVNQKRMVNLPFGLLLREIGELAAADGDAGVTRLHLRLDLALERRRGVLRAAGERVARVRGVLDRI